MQTPKTSVKSSSGSEGARRISPRSVTLDTKQRSSGRVVRQLKTSGLEANSSTSARTPKATSAKILDRTSPRGLDLEKKRPGRVAELETQINQLEDALRTVKDQLIVSESWKKQAKLDAEESRKELSAITLRLEESQNLLAISSSIEPNSNYVSAYEEIRVLKENLAEKHSIMEEMKNELEDSKSSESQAQALASETLQQLETAKKTMESLKLTSDEYNAIASELEQSRARVSSLESVIEEIRSKEKEDESEEIIALKSELENLKSRHTLEMNDDYNAIVSELNQSRARVSSLEATIEEIRAKEREIESEEIIALKSELENLKSRRTFEINDELKKSKEDIEELRSNLLDKETELQCVVEENEDLNAKLTNLGKIDFENLKSKLTSLETELCKKCDENETLKLEIKRMKSSNDEVADVSERLEVVKMSNCEMEEELRRLKVQMSQWRKAAEAATDMLCDENGDSGRMVEERAWSMGRFSPRKRMNMGLPASVEIDEEEDDEFLKRKDGNMLRRIGVLWKRPLNK